MMRRLALPLPLWNPSLVVRVIRDGRIEGQSNFWERVG